jgi:monomeric sarcosine oxidase
MFELSRRELAAALLAAPSLSAQGNPSGQGLRGLPVRSYVVIGAGAFGAWTAYHLRRAGHHVTLLDQYGPASSRASSGGETRIIRASYGPDQVYTRMAKRSLALWSAFSARTGREVLQRVGVLWMSTPDNAYVEQSRTTLRKEGVLFRDLSATDLKRDYPQIRLAPDAIAIFEPDSGALLARQATQAVVQRFIEDGGIYRHAAVISPQGTGRLNAIQTSDGESISADAFVFACGAWLGKVFPTVLGNRIFPTRQDVLFFGIPAGDRRFEAPQMPVWIDFSDNRNMYGFPDIETRGFKVAFDKHGPEFDPDTGSRVMTASAIEAARAYVSDRFPALADAPVVDSRVCQYENTANGDFVIDRLPAFENVWVAGGGSGHGFKHGPAVGEYAAARVTGAPTPAVEPRFSLESKGTEQKRAVY